METSPLQQFRDTVYQALPKRADATMDLLDALTATTHVESPVALSESVLFRRQFSSVYDVLEEGELPESDLRAIFSQCQLSDGETIAGYEVYAVDCTPDPRPEAETLPERVNLKSQKNQAVEVGEKFSWLVRLVKPTTSWVAPQDIARVSPQTTDSAVAVQQVQALDKQNDRLKVVVADSLYGNQYFLAVFLLVTTVVALVRLRRNLRLYENPIPKPPQSKGRPRVHGAAFKLTDPSRPADRSAIFTLAGQKIRLAAWHNLHLRKLPALVGMVLRLVADPSPPARGPAWRRTPLTKGQMLTPGMVQRGALPFLLTLGTPAAAPRPAGKGHGRPKGYHPQPKKRHPVVRKGQKQPKQTKKQHQMAV